ncbi:BolA family transcriptional regulator [Altererythrobacter sp. RZ02]|uniref:BolA family transcriptional regulator n=1 Tax=Pontixanthobacter rizhaonensis TaxID=2730337 RepID=A0A848QLS5_9SPHN|nr:BolA family transcriptional regulator [Pontixanthobacter rizhaonensis]NMW32104.1 BolA family transcriptional regulator [Pontixanthobacter rizhaonensis]
MPMSGPEIESMIQSAIPGAVVEMTDLAGDNDHWAAKVTAPEFAGKSRVQQHKMVYEALGGKMGGVLHALQLTTAVPTS